MKKGPIEILKRWKKITVEISKRWNKDQLKFLERSILKRSIEILKRSNFKKMKKKINF